jgi:C-terminal processing protease CtpA/Prc
MVQGECSQRFDDITVKLLYQIGCGYALLGETDTAISILRQLGSLGKLSYTDLSRNAEFDLIRGDPRFARLLDETTDRQLPWERLSRPPVDFKEYSPNLSCELKIAGLSTLWAEVKYNFSYFDRLPRLDWDSLYRATLPEVCATQSTFDYYQLLRRIGALLQDGHTTVFAPSELTDTLFYFPAVRTRLVGNSVFITDIYNPLIVDQGLLPGARIVKINGLPVHEYATAHVMPYLNASTRQDLLVRTYEYALLAGSCNQPVTIELVNIDRTEAVMELDRDWSLEELNAVQRDAEYRTIEGNIGHLILGTFHDEDLIDVVVRNLATIRRSAALIIDLRDNSGGYTAIALNILSLFMERSFQTHRWETPRYKPYRRALGGTLEWESAPAEVWPGGGEDAYPKPIVLLTSARTYSAAEMFAVAFRHAKRGMIFGERTGGSTGHSLDVLLPGNGAITICTTRDYFPDGTPFNGIGIEPDVAITPTISDMQSGRDVVLDAAIEHINLLLGNKRSVTVSASSGHTEFSVELGWTSGSHPRWPAGR